MNAPALQIRDVRKAYGATLALAGVTLDVFPGEIFALLGPSGCGKSTLLHLVAGLEAPDAGVLLWQGISLADVPPHARGFGLMFQDYALFPHLNVDRNVAFGLEYQDLPPDAARQRVVELLELVGLAGFERRDVAELSGGEQQRVALARALAPRPRLLMLDEPLGALDRALRERLLVDLRRILKSLSQTALYVTHDHAEAFAVADRVAVMRQGLVEQVGEPEEIYRAPRSRFVAEFLGFTNFIAGKLAPGRDGARLATALGEVVLPDPGFTGDVEVLLRPDGAAAVVEPAAAEAGLMLEGVVAERTFRGSSLQLAVVSDSGRFRFDFPAGQALPAAGEAIRIHLPPSGIRVYPPGEIPPLARP